LSTAKVWSRSAKGRVLGLAERFGPHRGSGVPLLFDPRQRRDAAATLLAPSSIQPLPAIAKFPGQNRRLKWTGQRRARSAGCPTLNFHHVVNHHGQPEEETPPEDEQAQAPEALEVAPSPEAHLAEVRRARPVRAALPSLGFYPTRRSPRRVFSLSGGMSAKGADCRIIEKR